MNTYLRQSGRLLEFRIKVQAEVPQIKLNTVLYRLLAAVPGLSSVTQKQILARFLFHWLLSGGSTQIWRFGDRTVLFQSWILYQFSV